MFFLKSIAQQKWEVLISRAISTLFLKHTRTRKNQKLLLEKNPRNYEEIRNETYVYEQKPVKIDDLNEAKEKEVKERIEKRKQKGKRKKK